MKEKRAKLNAKKKLENEKLQLKQERLRLLEEQNEKQRKNIIKKLNKMEKKKLELDKKKDEFYQQIKQGYQQIKQGLNMKVQGTKVNKNSLAKEADAKRDEILEYESYVFGLVKSKEAGNNNKKILSQCKTIQTQKDEQNRMREFKRIINTLQDDSVTNDECIMKK